MLEFNFQKKMCIFNKAEIVSNITIMMFTRKNIITNVLII